MPMSSVDVRRYAVNAEPAEDAADRLDADMRHVLNVLAEMGGKRIEDCRTGEARALPTLDMALRRILREPHDDLEVAMEMRLIPGANGELRARIYTPQAEAPAPRPAILYLHGG